MKAFIQKIREELSLQLKQIDGRLPRIQFYKLHVAVVQQAISAIKDFMHQYHFADKEEEIVFYKRIIPSFLELDILFSALYDLNVEKASSSWSDYRQFIKDERKQVDWFFYKQKSFHAYLLKEQTFFDEVYFTRSGPGGRVFDEQFCTTFSFITAQILAYEKYRSALHVELEQNGDQKCRDEERLPTIEFLGTDADIAELIPALVRLKLIRVNGKEVTQEQLMTVIDKYMGRDIRRNFSVIDSKNRARKKSLTPFLLRLIDAYVQRSEELLK
jgi:hypothetical protein